MLLTRTVPTPVGDRFRASTLPDRIPTPEIGQAIVSKRSPPRSRARVSCLRTPPGRSRRPPSPTHPP
ncbi:hypothetical protein NKG94_14380 [Micromonospora sp. M12]